LLRPGHTGVCPIPTPAETFSDECAPPGAVNPDLALVRLYNAFRQQRAVIYGFLVGATKDEDALNAALETRRLIAKAAATLRPATKAGVRARAAIALAMLVEEEGEAEWAEPGIRSDAATLRSVLAAGEQTDRA
jgi:hypothetical protein